MAAREMLGAVGGRIVVFQSVLPDRGCGALAPREDIKIRYTMGVLCGCLWLCPVCVAFTRVLNC